MYDMLAACEVKRVGAKCEEFEECEDNGYEIGYGSKSGW